jgi:hypothetical protein
MIKDGIDAKLADLRFENAIDAVASSANDEPLQARTVAGSQPTEINCRGTTKRLARRSPSVGLPVTPQLHRGESGGVAPGTEI